VKFRKKPVIISAELFDPRSNPKPEGVEAWPCDEKEAARPCTGCGQPMRLHGEVATLEGKHVACPGDWIITGVERERYPCKPEIFKLTYERVDGKDPETSKPSESADGDFGQALEAVKAGAKIARRGWNGRDMFVFLRAGRQITGVDPSSPMGGDFESLGHLCMRTADGKCCVGWLASQADMLSDDWFVVE